MKGVGNFSYYKVELFRPHFLISYHTEYGSEDSKALAVLSLARTVDDMRLALLVHDIKFKPILERMHSKLNYYLYELNEQNPIGYLIYHCSTLSNLAYSHIRFAFVENINKNNILYYIDTQSKLIGTYNNPFVSELQHRYMDVVVNGLFKNVLNSDNQQNAKIYNQDLYHLHNSIFNELPNHDGFEITEPLTILEFSKLLSTMQIRKFGNILNYLKKIKLLNRNDLNRMLKLFSMNHKQYQGTRTTS